MGRARLAHARRPRPPPLTGELLPTLIPSSRIKVGLQASARRDGSTSDGGGSVGRPHDLSPGSNDGAPRTLPRTLRLSLLLPLERDGKSRPSGCVDVGMNVGRGARAAARLLMEGQRISSGQRYYCSKNVFAPWGEVIPPAGNRSSYFFYSAPSCRYRSFVGRAGTCRRHVFVHPGPVLGR